MNKRFLTLSFSLFLLTSISRSPQVKFKVNDFFSLKDKITKHKSAEEQKIQHTKRSTHHSRMLATPILEDLSCKEAKSEDENKEFSPRKKIICREYNHRERYHQLLHRKCSYHHFEIDCFNFIRKPCLPLFLDVVLLLRHSSPSRGP